MLPATSRAGRIRIQASACASSIGPWPSVKARRRPATCSVPERNSPRCHSSGASTTTCRSTTSATRRNGTTSRSKATSQAATACCAIAKAGACSRWPRSTATARAWRLRSRWSAREEPDARSPQIHCPQVADRPPGRDRLSRGYDRVRVDAVVAIEIANFSGLTEVLDAERAHPVAAHGTEPGERCRMSVEHGDDAAMGRHFGKQPLNVAAGVNEPALARPARRGPAGVEPVRGGDGEEADVASVLRHQADGLDRFRRDRAGVGDDDLAIGPWPAQPIGAVDDRLAQLQAHRPFYLLDRRGGEAEINRAAGLVAQPVALRGAVAPVLLDVGEREGEDDRQFVHERRLEGGKSILRNADERSEEHT